MVAEFSHPSDRHAKSGGATCLVLRDVSQSSLAVGAVVILDAVAPGWSILVPVALIPSYAWRTIRRERTAEDARAAADDVYFLGYLCMIAALCSLGLQVWRDPAALDDPSRVALVLGMALLSTTIGLVAMKALKAHATTLPGQAISDLGGALDKLLVALNALDLPVAVRDLLRDLKEAPMGLVCLRQTSGEVEKTLRQMSERLDQVSGGVEVYLARVNEGVEKLNAEFTRLARDAGGQVDQLTGSVRQVEQVVDSFADLYESTVLSGAAFTSGARR